MLEALLADVRFGLRQLRLNPGFTSVAVLSLALGIGANTAMFQLIDALRLRTLPVANPSELVTIDKAREFVTNGWYSARNVAFTYAQTEVILAQQKAFTDVLSFGSTRFNLARGGEARYADALYVSGNYFDVLGVKPTLGRTITTEDDTVACSEAGAVLNYAFWQKEFGGDTAALGKKISLDGLSVPVIGVTPPDFFGVEPGRRFDLAVPRCVDHLLARESAGSDPKGRMFQKHAWWLTLIGRMKPGWTVEKASALLRDISPVVFRESVPEIYRPDVAKKYLENKLKGVAATAGVSELRRNYENPLLILLATTALVLLIACANLANLLLARASVREREVAVRQAIGASRMRLIAQLLSESMLLAVLGGLLGALVAQVITRTMVSLLNSGDSQVHLELGIDWRVFAFTAALALVTCILFGLAPAIRATDVAPANAMRGGRGTTGTAERSGLRRALVVSQIALSVVLLVGALLFGRSLRNLLTTETGIKPDGVIVASVDARVPGLQGDRRKAVLREILEKVQAEPGVLSASSVAISPFSGSGWNDTIYPEGDNRSSGGAESFFNRVGPGYFKTLSTTLLAGRDVEERDNLSAPKVAVVNEALAKKFFAGNNPVGRTFRLEGEAGKPDKVFQIVGLVKNTKYYNLREEFRPIAFLPMDQDEDPRDGITMMVRSRGPVSGVMAAVRQHMSSLNPNLIVEFRVLDIQVRQTVLRESLMASLSGGFGLLAGLLSTLGLYGVISYMVARRQNEIGVRMALGADWGSVIRLVLREAGKLVAIGLIIGIAVSIALSRFAESLLFGLKANDPLTLGLACGLLALTAILASFMPAWRA
ncbi:MAG: ABC transporter permease, partial [Bryobacteraceae bacterium]|nr:ABC transporter permease [Bryobacteraceae bacterium]